MEEHAQNQLNAHEEELRKEIEDEEKLIKGSEFGVGEFEKGELSAYKNIKRLLDKPQDNGTTPTNL